MSQTPAAANISLESWKSSFPFSFKYGGKDSSTFISTWTRSEETADSPGGQLHRYIFIDPATKLKVVAEVRTFANYEALDWVLKFSNEDAADTPIIEDIEPLNWTITPPAGNCILHHARGSNAAINDFEPLTSAFGPGGAVTIGSANGRSSDTTTLPFFNLQMGDRGFIGAIGWTGNWNAAFIYDKNTKALTTTAGMRKTHLLLHPGETIRTPRVVLLNWQGGDWEAAQNIWRHFVLTYYAPQLNGQPLVGPICYATWGPDPIAKKLAQIKMIQDEKLPFDVYWVDAGWYGKSMGDINGGPSPWWRNRGSWAPNPVTYPDGLKPLGDAVRAAGLGFMVWLEPEEADPDTTWRTQHPDWFFSPPNFSNPGTALLNLGSEPARMGITDFVSKMITDTGMTWYRQDFNVGPERSWAVADTPDRIGMSEIQHIEGLYTFWDQLHAEHPGLQIDNCASGGRRIDIETLSRSFPLWRSDLACLPFDAIASQMQTQGLAPWVPLNGGAPYTNPGFLQTIVVPPPLFDNNLLYTLRSGYSTALVLGIGEAEGKTSAWCANLKKILEEYREVQPFLYGDFYSLIPYSLACEGMTAMQWDRPDKKAGVVMVLRRPDCPYFGVDLPLHGINLGATYDVEIRTRLEKGEVKPMSGQDLAHLQISLSDKPGSALVFYAKR